MHTINSILLSVLALIVIASACTFVAGTVTWATSHEAANVVLRMLFVAVSGIVGLGIWTRK